jgi:hypothetical protein
MKKSNSLKVKDKMLRTLIRESLSVDLEEEEFQLEVPRLQQL